MENQDGQILKSCCAYACRHMLSLHKEDTSPLSEGNAILGTETKRRIQPVAVPGLEGTEKLQRP